MAGSGSRRRAGTMVSMVLVGLLVVGGAAALRTRPARAAPAFSPVADSYVESSHPTTNYGTASTMRVDASPTRRGYLRFDVQGAGVVSSAILKVYMESGSTSGVLLSAVADSTWTESQLRFDNAPPLGAPLGETGPFTGGGWRSYDVTAHVTGDGLYSFGLSTTSSTAITISSRESSRAPQLVINPPNPSPFTVTRSGSVYTASSALGTAYTGTLKAVVEAAVADLDPFPGATVQFGPGAFDLGSGWFEFHGVTDMVFAGAGMTATTLSNNSSASTDTEPFDMSNSDRITVRDLTVSAGGPARTTSDALDFDGGDDVLLENVRVVAARGRGIVFDGKDAVNDGHAVRNTIRNCVISGVPSHGIELLASSENRIEGCTVSSVGGNGIYVNKSSGVADFPNKSSDSNVIIANTVDRAGRDGIALNAGDDNLILDNTVTNSSQATVGRDGVRLGTDGTASCSANRIDGNNLSDDQPTPTQRFGLAIASAGCTANEVGSNTFSGNGSGNILDQGTGTIYDTGSNVFTPVADSYVDAGAPTTAFGSASTMKADASPIRRGYLRFNVATTGAITGARLRLYAASASSVGLTVSPLSDNTWTEAGLNYNNAPAPGAPIEASGPFSAGAYIEIDVTSLVGSNGLVSVVISTTSSTQISYQSREGANPPQLLVDHT